MDEKSTELKSGFIKIQPNKQDSSKPSNLIFKTTKLKKGFTEENVIDDTIQLYIKTNFPDIKFYKITDPTECQKLLKIKKQYDKENN